MADRPQGNPGIDLPYEIALPTFAATAWYHHMLGSQPADLESFLEEVEQFALGDYANALAQGANLPEDEFNAMAEKLHDYTGLPVAYIKKANLRVSGSEFEHELQNDSGLTTGRLDTRFSGPAMDPLGEDAEYDPQSAAIASAYVSLLQRLRAPRRCTTSPMRPTSPRSRSGSSGSSSISRPMGASPCKAPST